MRGFIAEEKWFLAGPREVIAEARGFIAGVKWFFAHVRENISPVKDFIAPVRETILERVPCHLFADFVGAGLEGLFDERIPAGVFAMRVVVFDALDQRLAELPFR